jgi:hypothetical protein
MADITQIQLRLKTPNGEGVGTDGDVFLGIAGREFYIDEDRDDFEKRDDHTYILGDSASILHAEFNDPRTQHLVTDDVLKFPAYIRFEPENRDDNWLLNIVQVTVNPGPNQIFLTRRRHSDPGDERFSIWLGQRRGKILYLEIEPRRDKLR